MENPYAKTNRGVRNPYRKRSLPPPSNSQPPTSRRVSTDEESRAGRVHPTIATNGVDETAKLSARGAIREVAPSKTIRYSKGKGAIPPISAAQLLREQRKARKDHPLHLLQPALNWLSLGPGIFELAGPGGAGKTQLALTLCLQAASVDDNQDDGSPTIRAMYISLQNSNLATVARRLLHMAGGDPTAPVLSRILTKACLTSDALEELLQHDLPRTLCQSSQPSPNHHHHHHHHRRAAALDCRVVILDSVAHLFRLDEDYAARAARLFRVAQQLRALVATVATSGRRPGRPLTVVVVNQATANLSSSTSTTTSVPMSSSSSSSSSSWSPALGLAWSHCVGTRFRIDRPLGSSWTSSQSERVLTLEQSSEFACPQHVRLRIGTAGCAGVVGGSG